jgi:pantoate--beta-alanine ligase
MIIARTIEEARKAVADARKRGEKISFVPTMGALHEGHLSLVRIAHDKAPFTVMSIFVNRIQFNDKSDFERYPRDFEKDAALAESAGCSMVFLPDDGMMYQDPHTFVVPEFLDEYLCGATRPGHFKGVCTVVTKLFNIILPDYAVFGQKDIQQCAIIAKMVDDLNIPVEITIAPILREAEGLAMSSRNMHLSTDERARALSIYRGLQRAEALCKKGERSSDVLVSTVRNCIMAEGRPDAVDYVSLVDLKTLHPVQQIADVSVLAVAAFFGKTRLIDNMIINRNGDSATCIY